MTHDPSSLSKLLVPESCTSNFANLSCILAPVLPDLSATRNLYRIEHALLLLNYWYDILVPVTWMKNFGRVP